MLDRGRFDWVVDSKLSRPPGVWNTRIYETEQFSVIPSLGSLILGWVLVVPRRPILNIRTLSGYERGELGNVIQSLTQRLEASTAYPVFYFEHGSNRRGSPMGCGLDQAHLHVVPLPFDLLESMENAGDRLLDYTSITNERDPWQRVPNNHDYLLAGDQFGHHIFACPQVPVSQWFRKLIAKKLEIPDQWDYRKHRGLHNILDTLKMFEIEHLPAMVS